MEQAIALAVENNLSIRAAEERVNASRYLKNTAFDLPKTDVILTRGQFNSYATRDNNITISQSIPFTVFGSQARLNRERLASRELERNMTANEIRHRVREAYSQLQYAVARQRLLGSQDSVYASFLKAATVRYQSGESNLLEKTTAESQANESRNILQVNALEIKKLQSELMVLLNIGYTPNVIDEYGPASFENVTDSLWNDSSPSLLFVRQQADVALAEKKHQVSKVMPDLLVGFFSQTLIGVADPETGEIASSSTRFTGFQVGVSIPLWATPHVARVRAAGAEHQAAEHAMAYEKEMTRQRINRTLDQIAVYQSQVRYYQDSGLPNADVALRQAGLSFRQGDISYTEYLFGLLNTLSIRENYLNTINNLNQAVNYYYYLTGRN
jgi:cobalt-zinc-cadmium resistance protein CzcA